MDLGEHEPWPRELEQAARLRALTDEQLAAKTANKAGHIAYPAEGQRRLVVALQEFKASSDKAAARLLFATWVLAALTVVIAALTVVLVVHPH